MSTLLLVGILYALKLFMIDFYIEEFFFDGLSLGSLQIDSFNVAPIVTIVILAFLISFVSALYRELDVD
ncbi:MAG: hypothetical protein WCX98_02930 [Candidatus Dojkabacteria bacterium]|jgi:hypothetical protein